MTSNASEASQDRESELSELSAGPGFSIRVASRMTGLSVDTLRMWERRYDFPAPTRNPAGNRLYTESDVARLTLVAAAMKLGYRAGEAIRLPEEKLRALLSEQPALRIEPDKGLGVGVGRLLAHVKSHDVDLLRRELRRLAGALGTRRFIVEVAAPMLETIGESWERGEVEVHQEHLVTEVLSSQLRMMLQQQEIAGGPKILLATLPRELHALGLQMAALMASTAGAHVEVLGPDSPTREIVNAATALRVEAVALSLSVAGSRAAASAHMQWLAEHLPHPLELWIGGRGAVLLEEIPKRARLVATWKDLDDAIQGLSLRL